MRHLSYLQVQAEAVSITYLGFLMLLIRIDCGFLAFESVNTKHCCIGLFEGLLCARHFTRAYMHYIF